MKKENGSNRKYKILVIDRQTAIDAMTGSVRVVLNDNLPNARITDMREDWERGGFVLKVECSAFEDVPIGRLPALLEYDNYQLLRSNLFDADHF